MLAIISELSLVTLEVCRIWGFCLFWQWFVQQKVNWKNSGLCDGGIGRNKWWILERIQGNGVEGQLEAYIAKHGKIDKCSTAQLVIWKQKGRERERD